MLETLKTRDLQVLVPGRPQTSHRDAAGSALRTEREQRIARDDGVCRALGRLGTSSAQEVRGVYVCCCGDDWEVTAAGVVTRITADTEAVRSAGKLTPFIDSAGLGAGLESIEACGSGALCQRARVTPSRTDARSPHPIPRASTLSFARVAAASRYACTIRARSTGSTLRVPPAATPPPPNLHFADLRRRLDQPTLVS